MRNLKACGICFAFIVFLLSGCAISNEAREASAKLVEKQQSSLQAHIDFHKAVISGLGTFLKAEAYRSEKGYEETIEYHNNSFIQELATIYSDTTLSEIEKKVKEEKFRIDIERKKQKALKNKEDRDSWIADAMKNVEEASVLLIKAEQAKTKAIIELDKYIQEKRPEEDLLGAINPFLERYQTNIDDAKEKVEKAVSIIEILKTIN